MRFITEFINDDSSWDATPAIIAHRRSNREWELGTLIANNLGWQNPVNNNSFHHRLEIEAFPMDKWMLFKTKLFHWLLQDNIPTQYYDKLIQELESFGKPAGEAKELKQ